MSPAFELMRSPDRALADMVEKHDRFRENDPVRTDLARMIATLKEELAAAAQVRLALSLR